MEKIIKLPEPNMKGGMPIMQALAERKSIKEFSDKLISMQQLSDLLWAMFGINRVETGKRTAPSAKNWQSNEMYIITKEATYHYNHKEHSLILLKSGDLRHIAGKQEYSQKAPLNILLISDLAKVDKVNELDKKITASADAGFISQNAYLYCSSEGLACVVRLMIDHDLIGKTLELSEQCWATLALTIGFAK
ncbi:MAG: SagB/ThcOx family dehydrogenase [Ignavibacteria bacterium]|jgi:SagB-type dehydrogenase family enzyme|nr:SagB/ThcOx family dehydrogenase [Ignavibacteria bacterium]